MQVKKHHFDSRIPTAIIFPLSAAWRRQHLPSCAPMPQIEPAHFAGLGPSIPIHGGMGWGGGAKKKLTFLHVPGSHHAARDLLLPLLARAPGGFF